MKKPAFLPYSGKFPPKKLINPTWVRKCPTKCDTPPLISIRSLIIFIDRVFLLFLATIPIDCATQLLTCTPIYISSNYALVSMRELDCLLEYLWLTLVKRLKKVKNRATDLGSLFLIKELILLSH